MSPDERPYVSDCTTQERITAALVADPSVDLLTLASRLRQPLDTVREAMRHLRRTSLTTAICEAHPNNSKRYSEACTSDASFWTDVLDQKHPPPREFEVHPSAFCPLDCWYCCSPNDYGHLRGGTRERNVRIGEYFHQLDGYVLSLQVSGGREPLFDRNLRLLVEPAHALGLHTRLNTSGFTSLSENALHEIAGLFDYIAVSLDAPDSVTYQQVKRISHDAAFDIIVQGIAKTTALNSDRGRIEVVVLVLPENVDCLDAITRLARDIGADGIRFRRLKTHTLHPATIDLSIGGMPVMGLPNSTPRAPKHLDPQYLLPVFADLQARWGTARFEVSFNKEDFALNYDSYAADNRSPCYSSNRRLVIDAHGDVFPCPLTAYPDEGIGHGKVDLFGANIMDYPSFVDLWSAVATGIDKVHQQPCATCYVADRYINNFINKLDKDRHAGVAIADQPFAHCSAVPS